MTSSSTLNDSQQAHGLGAARLPVVLRQRVPSDKFHQRPLENEPFRPLVPYFGRRWTFQTQTPSGSPVNVTVPIRKDIHQRDEYGDWWPPGADDNIYNCTAYALDTWNPETREGYLIDEEKGVWTVLNDHELAEVVMEPQKAYNNHHTDSATSMLYQMLPTKAPQHGDIFVLWDDQVQADGTRYCHHAAKLATNLPTDTIGSFDSSGDIYDLSEVQMLTKNGTYAPDEQALVDMIALYGYRTHAIYRLKAPTTLR